MWDVTLFQTEGEQAHYVALSHCWGGFASLYHDERHSSIETAWHPVTGSTKTFQDAVLVTAQLGVRYLWIDSLRMCQDDNDDWARESA